MVATMSIHMFLKCIMNLFGAMLIISIVTKPTNCDTCPNDTFSNFKVGNLSKCYWLFTSQKEGIGWNRYRNSTVIMGFCHGLQTSMGCGSTSSICVQTYNGTGANETKNYSVGKLIPNKNPYSAIKGNTGTDFKANFKSGANYTNKDNKTCVLQSEVYFQCNRNMKWKPVDAGKTAFLPANYITNVTFDESNCKFTVYVQYEGACTAITPPQPIPEDNSLSLGSILIIIFVVVVSTYFLFGCTFKFCYGYRGPEVLPHSEFWIDLPVLITDGIAFTLKCGKTDMARNYDGI